METFQVALQKLGLSSRTSKTILILAFLALPFLIIFTLIMYQDSNFSLFDGVSKAKTQSVASTKDLNLTDEAQNDTTVNKDLSQNTYNGTVSALSVLEGRNHQNITTLGGGTRNGTFRGSRNETLQSSNSPTEKLLDGLVARGFDEVSCLSRYQSYSYRKTSSLDKPSSYLISKLLKYEKIHKQCGPHSKSYKKTIRKFSESRPITGSTACKYIVWLGANGLGNRMLSISSVFLYAILTNRVLLVDFGTDMTGLFCEPFPNSSWLLPKGFPHKKKQNKVESYKTILKTNIANNSIELLPSILFVDLEHGHDDNNYNQSFYCDHNQVLLQKVPALFLRSDQYLVPSLFMIPSFKQELRSMFPDKEKVLYHLGRYLFLPSNDAWGLISRFYQAYLAKADERIGIQIRVFNTKTTPSQTVMDQVLACTLNNKILPRIDMQKSVASSYKNQTSKAVLIASLYSEYTEKLRTMYWTNPTVDGDIIGVYQPSHEEYQKFGNNIHNMKAWAEIYLLSLCDVLVTSSQSTFGYVAQSLGGLKPWILHKTNNEKIPNPPCERDLSMEPCFHFPPKYDCNAQKKLNVTSSFPFMRPCVDWRWGVKMVNDL